jgi:hypothetical protein
MPRSEQLCSSHLIHYGHVNAPQLTFESDIVNHS